MHVWLYLGLHNCPIMQEIKKNTRNSIEFYETLRIFFQSGLIMVFVAWAGGLWCCMIFMVLCAHLVILKIWFLFGKKAVFVHLSFLDNLIFLISIYSLYTPVGGGMNVSTMKEKCFCFIYEELMIIHWHL